MSSTSWNHTDTAVSAVGSLQPDSLNFSVDFAKMATKAQEAVVTNLTSPVDRKETIRWAYSRIANVYTGSDISPSAYAMNKTGASVLAQLNCVLSFSDDAGVRTDLPLSAHLVMKVPNHEAITGTILSSLLKRLVGTLYEESDSSMDARLTALVHGAVLPKAIS